MIGYLIILFGHQKKVTDSAITCNPYLALK
jgi:hypothetical protein